MPVAPPAPTNPSRGMEVPLKDTEEEKRPAEWGAGREEEENAALLAAAAAAAAAAPPPSTLLAPLLRQGAFLHWAQSARQSQRRLPLARWLS